MRISTTCYALLATAACCSLHLPTARADDLTVVRTALAVQDITVPDGSPLGLLLPPQSTISADGPLLFEFDGAPPRDFAVESEFIGTVPAPFLLAPHGMTGHMAPDGNRFHLTATGHFDLQTYVPLGPGGQLVLVRVFTLQQATFTGDVPGVGFAPGTVFTSPAPVLLGLEIDGVILADGDGPIPVGFSSQRTVTIIKPSED